MTTGQQPNQKQYLLDVSIICVAAFLLVLPMMISGIPSGNDLPHHFRFALGFQESLSNGVVFPGWDGLANHGFGDVGLRFYPPISYIILNAFVWVSADWYIGSVLTFLFLFLLGGVGVYFWTSEWFTRSAAVLGALIYMSLPYHVNQIYNAFFVAEFAAAAFIPFCFWIVDRISKKPDLQNAAFLGLAYSAVVLTHLPTGLMLSIGLVVYAVLLFGGTGLHRKTATFVSGVATGLLISAFYLIRVLTEAKYLRHAQADFTNYDYDFNRNFLFSYFQSSGTDYLDRSLWFGDLMLALTLVVAIAFAIVPFWSRNEKTKQPVIAVSGLLLLSVFFATPVSSVVWSNFSTLAKIQFPFRWMILITLAASFMVAAGYGRAIEYFRNQQEGKAVLLFALVALSLSFTVFQIIRPARMIEATEFRSFIRSLSETESCECWWPVWAKPVAFQRPERVEAGDRAIEVHKWDGLDRRFTVGPGTLTHARIANFYYPNWKATQNDEPAGISYADDGTLLVELPAEEATVSLVFEEPLVNRVAGLISLSTFALVLALFCFTLFQRAVWPQKVKT